MPSVLKKHFSPSISVLKPWHRKTYFHTRYYEEKRQIRGREEEYLRRVLMRGGNDRCLWDIGANIGLFSVCYGNTYPAAPVYGFEPTPVNFSILRENIHLNGLKNITACHFALGNRHETLTISGQSKPGWGGCSLLRGGRYSADDLAVECPVYPGDALIETQGYAPPALVKIDVEGYEMNVLEGLSRTIQRVRPVLCLELHQEYLAGLGIGLGEAVKKILDMGYVPEYLEKNPLGLQYQGLFIQQG